MEAAAHHSHFVQAPIPWYDVLDTYIVRFVVVGCRKNLPLYDLRDLRCQRFPIFNLNY